MLNRSSVPEQIKEELLRRIAEGELKSGERIIESRISKEFGVSSIPVREAISQLVAMGVLDSAPHRGAWVREVSIAETVDALEVREGLEALAARIAATKMKGNAASLIETAHRLIDAVRNKDKLALKEQNQIFHKTVVYCTENATLIRMWDSLAFDIRSLFTIDFLQNADMMQIATEHLLVAEAIQEGNQRKAAELAAQHSKGLCTYLRKRISENSDKAAG